MKKNQVFLIGNYRHYPATHLESFENPYIKHLVLDPIRDFNEKDMPVFKKVNIGDNYMYLIDQESFLYLAPFCSSQAIKEPEDTLKLTDNNYILSEKVLSLQPGIIENNIQFHIRRIHRKKLCMHSKFVPLEVDCDSSGPEHFVVLDKPTNVLYGWGKNPYGALGPENPYWNNVTLGKKKSAFKMDMDPLPIKQIWENLDRPNIRRRDQKKILNLTIKFGCSGSVNTHLFVNDKWILIGLKCQDEEKNCNFPLFMSISSKVALKGVSGQMNHAIGWDENGKAYAWGFTKYGKLGLIPPVSSNFKENCFIQEPTMISMLSDEKVTSCSTGITYSSCLTEKGQILVWGRFFDFGLKGIDSNSVHELINHKDIEFEQTLDKYEITPLTDACLGKPRPLNTDFQYKNHISTPNFVKMESFNFQIVALDTNKNLYVCGFNSRNKLGFSECDKIVRGLNVLADFENYEVIDFSLGKNLIGVLATTRQNDIINVNHKNAFLLKLDMNDPVRAKRLHKQMNLTKAETILNVHKDSDDGSMLNQIIRDKEFCRSVYERVLTKLGPRLKHELSLENLKQPNGLITMLEKSKKSE